MMGDGSLAVHHWHSSIPHAKGAESDAGAWEWMFDMGGALAPSLPCNSNVAHSLYRGGIRE